MTLHPSAYESFMFTLMSYYRECAKVDAKIAQVCFRELDAMKLQGGQRCIKKLPIKCIIACSDVENY